MPQTLPLARRLLAIFCGGFFGTIVRYLLSILIQGYLGRAWPYDILGINITGAFVLAFITTLADASVLIGPMRRLLINVGFLGAYTTFSSLALGDILLFTNGHWLLALLYLAFSIIGGVIAVLLGDIIGQWSVKQLKNRAKPIIIEGTKADHLDVQDDLLLPD